MAPSEHKPFTLRLFGPFAASVNGDPLARLRSRKGYALLALLALRHGREVERAWLAGTLWPDTQEPLALVSLRTSLKDLRRALGPEAARLRSVTSHTLCLDLQGADVDLVAFDAAIMAGDATALERATGLYRGPLLEGWSEEWLCEERRAREESHRRALEQLATIALQHDRPGEAAHYLRQLITADPLRENAHRSLIQALAAEGNFAAALQVYRDLRLLLHRELNTEPAPETRACYEEVRAQARRAADGHGEEGERERGREGETRGPVRVSSPSLAHSLTPSLPPAPPPSSPKLPHPLTRLIGRERELRQAMDGLAAGRLVTLTGTGGIGKTRLALAVAHELAADHEDGACFVELAALTDPALVPRAIGSALELGEAPGGTTAIDTLRHYLLPREVLLVLDNCEHLREACAGVTETLLRGCPRLRILATSRQALGLAGEQLCPIPPLSLPGPSGQAKSETLTTSGGAERREPHVAEFDAIQLFVARAAAVAPAFALTPENSVAIAQVCRRLDGIPLALELAAARLKALPVEQLAARIDDCFRLLSGGNPAGLARHRTLRATMDWSYNLLTVAEQKLFQRLSVFAGGWTLEAAEVVCGEGCREQGVGGRVEPGPTSPLLHPTPYTLHPEAVLDLLTSLVDKSLVQYEERSRTARYRLLETVRQYAKERLSESGEEAAARAQHLRWCLTLAEQDRSPDGAASLGEWLDRLESEHDNLRAALEWEGDVAAALNLAAALDTFWHIRGYLSEGRATLTRLLDRGAQQADPLPREAAPLLAAAKRLHAARARALGVASSLARRQADYPASRAHLESAMALLRALDSKKEIADLITGPLRALSNWTWEIGFRVDRACYEEALAIYTQLHDERGAALARHLLDRHEGKPGDSPERRLALSREHHDIETICVTLCGLGNRCLDQSEYESARKWLEESVTASRNLGFLSCLAFALHTLGLCHYYRGDYDAARAQVEEARALREKLGDRRGLAYSLSILGVIARCQGRRDTARKYAAAGLAIAREFGGIAGINVWPLLCLGDTAADENRFAEARAHLGEALGIVENWQSRQAWLRNRGIAVVRASLGRVALAEGARAEAHHCFRTVVALPDAPRYGHFLVNCLEGVAATLVASSEIAADTGDSDRHSSTPLAVPAEANGGRTREARQAALLLAASAAIRGTLGTPIPPPDRWLTEESTVRARAILGDKDFSTAWDEGRMLTIEQAIGIALEAVSDDETEPVQRLENHDANG